MRRRWWVLHKKSMQVHTLLTLRETRHLIQPLVPKSKLCDNLMYDSISIILFLIFPQFLLKNAFWFTLIVPGEIWKWLLWYPKRSHEIATIKFTINLIYSNGIFVTLTNYCNNWFVWEFKAKYETCALGRNYINWVYAKNPLSQFVKLKCLTMASFVCVTCAYSFSLATCARLEWAFNFWLGSDMCLLIPIAKLKLGFVVVVAVLLTRGRPTWLKFII